MGARTVSVLALAVLALTSPWGAALAACQLHRLAELPVTTEDLRPLVKGKINGTEISFILDSGGFYSSISRDTASELHLRLSPPPRNMTITGFGGQPSWAVTTVKEFTFAGVPIHGVEFVVDPSTTLGQNVLSLFDVEYDLGNGFLRFWHPSDCGHGLLAYWVKPDQAYSLMDVAVQQVIRGEAFLNGARIRVMFDTGSPTSLLSLRAARLAGVKPGDPGVIRVRPTRGLGRDLLPTWIAQFASLKIGDEEIHNPRLRITELSGLGTDMLLGADFFLSHRVFVANSQQRIYFTYNGGPVFNLGSQPANASQAAAAAGPAQSAQQEARGASAGTARGGPATAAAGSTPAAPSTGPPPDAAQRAEAADLGRRGAAYASRRDFEHAIADLTRASELDPSQPQYFLDRAKVYVLNKQPSLASADLDRAIKLDPHNVAALMLRARLRIGANDKDAAILDLDAAAGAVPKEDGIREALGQLYQAAGAYAAAVSQYDLWIAAHQEDPRWGVGFMMRCNALAVWGHDLDKALHDCNTALHLLPRNEAGAVILQNRGMIRLRRGELDRAIADFGKSIKLQPKNAWSLYGRGVALVRKGMSAQAEADLVAARALEPDIEDWFRKDGIIP